MLSVFKIIDLLLAIRTYPNPESRITGLQKKTDESHNEKMIPENELFHKVKILKIPLIMK